MVEFEDAPKVHLGGREWPVPLLVVRQNRIIVPLILSLVPLMAAFRVSRQAGLAKVGEKEYDAMSEICYQAIRRAQPEFSHDQFNDLPVQIWEMVQALEVIAEQSGLLKRDDPGEAPGVGNPQTGMDSSPTSAT
jgi:hypothetical protein